MSLPKVDSESSVETESSVESKTSTHPLTWTFRYATSLSNHIRRNINDYSCRLVKRERIDGKLQKHQFIQVKVRCEKQLDGEVVEPMAVFMQYLAPAKFKDRRVLFIAGQNDGKMLVRKGGRAFKFAKLQIDPNSSAARRESNYPITDVGFDKIIERLIRTVTDDIKNDPTAANTLVSHFRNAKINDRVCTHIKVEHPQRGDGLEFHKASLYIDDELNVPIRLTAHGWPEKEGNEAPLIEEYTYVDLRLNVGLSDSDFSRGTLDSTPTRTAKAPAAKRP